jgi:hypothetical protein
LSHGAPTGVRDGELVAGVEQRAVHHHADVVDHGDALVDHRVPRAVERQGEGPRLDHVAVGDHVDLEPVRRVRHALRAVQDRVGVRLAQVGELVGRPVVGVLVRDDDRVDVVQVDQGSGERSRVDDELAPVLLDDEAGVFEFREAHEADCTPAGVPDDPPEDRLRTASGQRLDYPRHAGRPRFVTGSTAVAYSTSCKYGPIV